MQPGKAVHALREALTKSGREALMPRIARAFDRVAHRQLQRSGFTLTVAHVKEESHARAAAKRALASAGITRADMEVRTDPSLIGGWRLEGADHLFDSSYKKHLLQIYKNVTNA